MHTHPCSAHCNPDFLRFNQATVFPARVRFIPLSDAGRGPSRLLESTLLASLADSPPSLCRRPAHGQNGAAVPRPRCPELPSIARGGAASARPRRWQRPGQVFKLQRFGLTAVEDRLNDVGGEQGQPQQAVEEAAGKALGLGQFGDGPAFSLFQPPLPTVGSDHRTDQRFIGTRPRRRPCIAAVRRDDHLAAAAPALRGHPRQRSVRRLLRKDPKTVQKSACRGSRWRGPSSFGCTADRLSR
jgi:hypothetical protein